MPRKRNPESGYAMMMIFAMAAILAITLYTEVPRVAFEAQRDKEQLLIDRGEEYQRAVTLFVRKFNRFPSSMEELENTNNQRFLRRRFVDPLTGKNDWRLIHAGPGGVLTDSVNSTQKTDDKSQNAPQNFITDIGVGPNGPNQAASGDSVNLATRKRPSDSGTGAGYGGGSGGEDTASSQQPTNTGIPGYSGPVMVLPDGRIVPANPTGVYTPPGGAEGASGRITPMPGMGITPGGTPTGIPPGGLPFGAPGAAPGQINPGLPPTMPSGVAVQQGMPQGSAAPGGPPGAAAALINQILTSPRGTVQGTSSALQQQMQQQFQQSQFGQPTTTSSLQSPQQQNVIGAGIAGVASKVKGEGIKTVNDHTKYNEWEFVYDVTKDPTRMGGGMAGAVGGSGAQGINPTMGAQPGMTPGMSPGMTPGMTPPSAFGRGGPGH